jgi:hypothetical protein
MAGRRPSASRVPPAPTDDPGHGTPGGAAGGWAVAAPLDREISLFHHLSSGCAIRKPSLKTKQNTADSAASRLEEKMCGCGQPATCSLTGQPGWEQWVGVGARCALPLRPADFRLILLPTPALTAPLHLPPVCCALQSALFTTQLLRRVGYSPSRGIRGVLRPYACMPA